MKNLWQEQQKTDVKEDVKDEPLSGRSTTSTTPGNVERVRRMLAADRRLSLRMIAGELQISLDSVSTTVHKHLHKRKICTRFAPHSLPDEQKQYRMETSGDFIDMCDRNPQFLETIITGVSRGAINTIRIPCSNLWHGVQRRHQILVNSYPRLQPVNAEYYEGVLKRLLLLICRIRPQYWNGQWNLLHDNARAHTAIRVTHFLHRHQVPALDHPPYSPDLAPADFFLFPRLKGVLKGQHFSDITEIQQRVTTVLRAIPKEAFADSFQQFYTRCQKCIVADGEYFEGQ
ncbi:histone-lysine N-methyltransferase SETMAR-like [Stegodyphus dumicola]|uniref:histone-lysine N-methyltransferase SETMAR-like n=1 Tax=Stegodyphus dumicola TaxID=202533 RepID=UPI0015ACF69B|nr:histone-lysine N-methyltransferase SETMAR-like [Stegodyphus dumicola]